jgi:type VI secretion system secreted protein VgrG
MEMTVASQSDYRFQFQLPDGPTFDVVRFELTEGLSQPFRLWLELSCFQHDVDLDALLDGAATFTIARDGQPVRQVHGIVTALEQGDTGFRRTRYRAVIEPPLVRLDLRRNSRIFQRVAVPAILKTLLDEQRVVGTALHLLREREHVEREYCVQHREQDLAFFQRLAGEEGLVYFFDARNQSGLVLTDALLAGPSLAGPNNSLGTVAYQPRPGGDAAEPGLWRFAYRRQMASTRATQRDYSFKNPPYRQEHQARAKDGIGDYENYDAPGRYKHDEAGKPFTRSRLSALRRDTTQAELEGDDARLWPGLAFALDGHPSSSLPRNWRVVAMRHEGEQSSGQEEDSIGAEQGSRYRYTGTAVPDNADWQPEPCPRPVMDGLQVAHVVGPPGEEIHTDEYGRVMVWFPWDREGPKENSSCWIRVSQGWAGASYGMMALPRIGHEVLVSFLDGDPDQPIVTGRSYHVTNRPPYELPRHKTRSTWKSQTHKGEGSNEIRFEDEKDLQEIFIHAQKDQNNVVGHDETTRVGNDRTETVGRDETISIGQDRKENVGRDETLAIGQDRAETVGRNHTLEVVHTRNVKVGQDLIEDVGNQRLEKTATNRTLETGGHYRHTVQGRHEVEAGERISRRTNIYQLDAADRVEIRGPGGTMTFDRSGITFEAILLQFKGAVEFSSQGKGNALVAGLSQIKSEDIKLCAARIAAATQRGGALVPVNE